MISIRRLNTSETLARESDVRYKTALDTLKVFHFHVLIYIVIIILTVFAERTRLAE